ncbi:MAG: hypothetical protein ACOYI5_09495 [Christensenellales bacterium]|jgi:hypothetical protein
MRRIFRAVECDRHRKRPPGAIAGGDRLNLGFTAPAHGLTLMKVYYDAAELPRACTQESRKLHEQQRADARFDEELT